MGWEEPECAGTYIFAHVFVSMGLGEAQGSKWAQSVKRPQTGNC